MRKLSRLTFRSGKRAEKGGKDMKLFKKGIISILCGAICLLGVACGQKPTTKPDDGPIGEVDVNKQITLRIESAAPLKSN